MQPWPTRLLRSVSACLVVLLVGCRVTFVVGMIRLTRRLTSTRSMHSMHLMHTSYTIKTLQSIAVTGHGGGNYETQHYVHGGSRFSRLFCTNLHDESLDAGVHTQDSYSYTSEDVSVDHLLSTDSIKSHISPFWIQQLKRLQRPVAKGLIGKINPNNVLGYESYTGPPKKGTLLENIIQWKRQHSDKVILTRVGEFYEAYGVDALMLINYAGLNAMAGAAKAGCPIRNVQATLDALTQAGLSVAVYEEISEVESGRGYSGSLSSKLKMKKRVLSQVVSPASSTYIYDNMCLRSDDIEFRENRPAVGILRTVNGYTLCQIHLDTSLMSISERLTEEGVRSLLGTSGYIEPLYLQDCSPTDLPFLYNTQMSSNGVERMSGYSESNFPDQVLRRVSRALEMPSDNIRICNRNSYASLVKSLGSTSSPSSLIPLMPIYTSTALQIGLTANDNVPDLIPHLLPSRSHSYIARFLRKWLLNPPPVEVADYMRDLCRALLSQQHSQPPVDWAAPPVEIVQACPLVPRFTPISIAKVVTLINAQQCNVALFREIRRNMEALQLMLRKSSPRTDGQVVTANENDFSTLVTPLLALTSYECGVRAEHAQLLQETAEVLEKIDYVVPKDNSNEFDLPSSDANNRIPSEFFSSNEHEFRGKIVPSHPNVEKAYKAVKEAANSLCNIVNAQFPEGYVVQYDSINNAVMLRNELVPGRSKDRSRPSVVPLATKDFQHYVDRKGKSTSRSYTTPEVSEALSTYINACYKASHAVSNVLRGLSSALQGRHLISIIQAAHWAVILEAATLHTVSSRQKGWVLPDMVDFQRCDEIDCSLKPTNSAISLSPLLELNGLSPYWMDRATCTLNPVKLRGIYLLTAPNMSGKSTLMRSVLVAALLANCGLCIPCDSATVPRYDHYFLRTASYDVPSEAKSAFALEMDDVRVMMRDCTRRSLVMIDELGKGTSAKDGSALSGALLEHLDQRCISGIFATHLHELFRLPLKLTSVTDKKMGFSMDTQGNINWNYHLEDGRCTDSMALVTAKKYGISADIINRAKYLSEHFEALCRNESKHSNLVVPSNITESEVDVRIEKRERSWADADHPAGRRYHLSTDIAPVLRSLAGADDTSVQIIPAAWEPPVSLEGSSCVYVLQLYSLTKEFLPDVLYVGETESIRQRLQQHRDQQKAQGYSFNAAVMRVPDKSTARRLETSLIKALKYKGFDIENDSDSSHVLFGNKR